MLKKITSFLLALSLMIAIFPTYALDSIYQDEFNKVNENRVIMQYNGVTAEKIDNKIYIDGTLIATIFETTENNPTNIEPRTGWTYSNTCPYGNMSEYTKYIDRKEKNIQLEKDIASIGVTALSLVIGLCYPDKAVGAAVTVAGAIIANIPGAQYGKLKTLYFVEYIYGHQVLSSIYRMNQLRYYYDAAYSEYATTDTYYSWWG